MVTAIHDDVEIQKYTVRYECAILTAQHHCAQRDITNNTKMASKAEPIQQCHSASRDTANQKLDSTNMRVHISAITTIAEQLLWHVAITCTNTFCHILLP